MSSSYNASYDKPALPHFTGRGDLEATLDALDNGLYKSGRRWLVNIRLARRCQIILHTLATADTPPEEMR